MLKQKWDNNLPMRIPKGFAKTANSRGGNAITIETSKDGIDLKRTERTPTLDDLVAKITPENRHPETNWGPDRGKERIE